jgi:hypothetical protein
MTTTTTTVKINMLGAISYRLEELNARISKRALGSPVTLTTGDSFISTDEETRIETTYIEVTLSYTPVVLTGGYTLAAIADYTSTDTALVFDLAETGLTADDFNRTRCDHCSTTRTRNKVFAVIATDGTLKFVGSSCVKDFLGVNPADLLFIAERFASALDDDNEGYLNSNPKNRMFATDTFIEYATALVSTSGYVKGGDTRDAVVAFLYEPNHAAFEDARAALRDPANKELATQAIAWAAAYIPSNTTTDFDRNMFTVATSDMLGRSAFGIAAYLPVAYSRHLDNLAAKAAESAGPVADVPEGRNVVTGTIVSTKVVESQYGTAYKMIVLDDRGFKVYCTQPSAISEAGRGDRVSFTATLSRSDDDPTFGFGSRPTKASAETSAAELVGV